MIDFTCSDPILAEQIEALRHDAGYREKLFAAARAVRNAAYGPVVFFRGLIEISNFCRQDCYYCGIRKSRHNLRRFRIDEETILQCCRIGYEAGYRTFVLQGGEDPAWTVDRLARLIQGIRLDYPDCAITLSLGEMTAADYRRLYDAGADRYLLRHETADPFHYRQLHPAPQSFQKRANCLTELHAVGFQTGAGMMIGSPGQTTRHLVSDLRYLMKLQPHMVGIGPFMPASDTPFAHKPAGGLDDTLIMIALTRLLLPEALIPSTTALGSLLPQGRMLGLQSGANVLMPNLSPPNHRSDYRLYDKKAIAQDDVLSYHQQMVQIVQKAGMCVDTSRGDAISSLRGIERGNID